MHSVCCALGKTWGCVGKAGLFNPGDGQVVLAEGWRGRKAAWQALPLVKQRLCVSARAVRSGVSGLACVEIHRRMCADAGRTCGGGKRALFD
jgi:hypothetical protein